MYEFLDRLFSVALPRVKRLQRYQPQLASTAAATLPSGMKEQLDLP